MKRTYMLELEVALDEADEQKIIAAARGHYQATGHAQAPVGAEGQTWRNISAEEAIPDAVEAIMELIGGDATLEEAGIEVASISYNEPNSGDTFQERDENCAETQVLGAVEAAGQDAPSLDEFETGMYLCRWPNGEFSLVRAETRMRHHRQDKQDLKGGGGGGKEIDRDQFVHVIFQESPPGLRRQLLALGHQSGDSPFRDLDS